MNENALVEKVTVSIKRKNVYGNELIYPCNMKEELRQLTGKKTLDMNDLKSLKALGVQIYDCDEEIKKLSGWMQVTV